MRDLKRDTMGNTNYPKDNKMPKLTPKHEKEIKKFKKTLQDVKIIKKDKKTFTEMILKTLEV